MKVHTEKKQENKSKVVTNDLSKKQSGDIPTFQFVNNRQEATSQRKMQEVANHSRHDRKIALLQAKANNHLAPQPVQKKVNKTGLPDKLKTGIESLSGYSMDDVKVHYNSDKPAQLNAHAYAQGTDIHLATGQEKHLPHEAWHVVQQKQGRVKPTMQMRGKVNVNDDVGLEKEADVMGSRASEAVEKNSKDFQLKKDMVYSNKVMRLKHMLLPSSNHIQRKLKEMSAQDLPENDGTNKFLENVLLKYSKDRFNEMDEKAIEKFLYKAYSTAPIKANFSNASGDFKSSTMKDTFGGNESWKFSALKESRPSTFRMMIRFRDSVDINNVSFFISKIQMIAEGLMPLVSSFKNTGDDSLIGNRTDPLIIYTSQNPENTEFEKLHKFILDHAEILDFEKDPAFYQKANVAPFYFGKQPTYEHKKQGIESFGTIFTTAVAQAIVHLRTHFDFMYPDIINLRGMIQFSKNAGFHNNLDSST